MRDITVLIADDEASVRHYFAAVIEREKLPVKRLVEAENGLAALRLALDHKPDLAFLDVRMPGHDGLEVAKMLQKEVFPGTVVVISAYGEFDYAQQAMRAGAVDYLLKPVKPAEIAAHVHTVAGSLPVLPVQQQPVETQHPPLVRSVISLIAGNLAAPLRLEDIARAVHVSPWHLSRTFKKLTGQSIADCVRDQRIKKAGEMLAGTDLSVTEVAGLVGFENAGYFATCFKQITGESPSEYRAVRKQSRH